MKSSTHPSETLLERLKDLDAQMHALLIERAQVVQGLIAAHRATGDEGPVLDPVRDAERMRLLVERHEGDLPLTAVEHLWRDIVATCAFLEAPFTVHLDGGAELLGMLDAARYHFGFNPELEAGSDAADVVGVVAGSQNDIGLIALSDRSDLPWWRGLSETGARVTARLPFLVLDTRPADLPMLVISRAEVPRDQQDVIVYDARWGSVLPGDLMGQGIEVVSFHRSASGVDALIAVSADLDETEALKACADAGAEPDVLRPVGGYTAAIDIESDTNEEFETVVTIVSEG